MSANLHIPDEFTDASRGIRLQKAMAEAGVASRRDCEAMVAEGRVTVNGKLVAGLPAWVDPAQDRVEVDGRPIQKRTEKSTRVGAHRPVYLAINKPKRVISTSDDPDGRTTVLDLVDVPMKQRLFAVGRLDAESTGLMLLTNDGELANRLTHPRYRMTKQYRVSVKGRLDENDLRRLRRGLLLTHDKGARVKRAAVEWVRILKVERDRERGDRTVLAITLAEGQNREIRRLLARQGLHVRRLDRIGIGPLRLKGIARGSWRPLTPVEIGKLRKAAGLGR